MANVEIDYLNKKQVLREEMKQGCFLSCFVFFPFGKSGKSFKENGVENATAGKKGIFFQVRSIKYSQTFNAF